MTNTTTNETAPWRSPSGKYAVRWIHLSIGWRFWAFERNTGEDVGHFTSRTAAIRACERAEKKSDAGIVRAALVIGVLAGIMGCATAPRAPEVETVGAISASSSHVYTAPVHATTDLTPGFQAIDTDEEPKAEAVAAPVEAPEVVSKSDGISLGTVRQ